MNFIVFHTIFDWFRNNLHKYETSEKFDVIQDKVMEFLQRQEYKPFDPVISRITHIIND